MEIVFAAYDVDDDQASDSPPEHLMTINVRQYIPHENYEDGQFNGWDIALIRLETPIPEWNDGVRPICLPEDSTSGPMFETGFLTFLRCTNPIWS